MQKMAYFVDDTLTIRDLLRGAIEAGLDVKTFPYVPTDIIYKDDEGFERQQSPDVIIVVDRSSNDLRVFDPNRDKEKGFALMVRAWRLKFPNTPIILACGDSSADYFDLSEVFAVERVNTDRGTTIGAFETLCGAIKKAIA